MISIVIPAYNAESTLPGCLRALKQQTAARSEYEIIVVDDGLATGATMRATLLALRAHRPARLVAAVPVGAPIRAMTCGMTPTRSSVSTPQNRFRRSVSTMTTFRRRQTRPCGAFCTSSALAPRLWIRPPETAAPEQGAL